MNELQLALVGVGGALVVGVVIYNKWQERKHRQVAERVFRGDHPDVLLDAEPAGGERPYDGRIEPSASFPPSEAADPVPPQQDQVPTIQVAEETPEPVANVPEPASALLDERVDCVVRFESAEAVAAPALWQAHQRLFMKLMRPLRWIGWDETHLKWTEISPHNASGFRRLRGALQLADRRGPLSETELSLFVNGIQRLSDEFLAVSDMPPSSDILARAVELDRFCASVDVQIGINVVSQDGQAFSGTKLRGLAEASGLTLAEDGLYHATDDDGLTLFTLGNLEAALFDAESMKHLSTHGLTLTLDVPRVAKGTQVFDRMTQFGKRLADSLNGRLVDDNRALLSDNALAMIRKSIGQFQEQMTSRGIPAGGALARRLFS